MLLAGTAAYAIDVTSINVLGRHGVGEFGGAGISDRDLSPIL
jgi:hypothetical protein